MTVKCGGGRKTPELTATEIRRYGRQMIVPEVGLEGQAKLKGASVLLVGLGGLGSAAARGARRRPSFRAVGVREFERMRRTDKNLLVLDIREEAEAAGAAIPGAPPYPEEPGRGARRRDPLRQGHRRRLPDRRPQPRRPPHSR